MNTRKWLIVFASLILCVGIGATQALAAAVNTANNNFTMIDAGGNTFGGTNDVSFTWDGTLKTAVAASGQVSNATIASATPCLFFGHTWSAHDVAIYGPGTYTVYDGCAAQSPGCGAGNAVTFTVGANEIAAHMLFDWNVSTDIDVVDVWQRNAVFGPSQMCDGNGSTGGFAYGCGFNSTATVWDWMSYDWDLDGINGAGMTDGPFLGSLANFNVMGNPCGVSCDDNDACTTDTCDFVSGSTWVCNHTGVFCCGKPDGTACTIDACTTGATCTSGVCGGGTALNCDDNNICTTDTCNTVTGCVHTPAVPASCDDNDACTTDGCTANACTHVTISCNDNDACTTDTCDPVTGCVYTPIPNCGTGVNSSRNNFTMVDSAGLTFGGTNDVKFTWDETMKTAVVASGQVSNATISSAGPCPFFGATWSAHDVAIYGPGTYTIYTDCPKGSPGCGSTAKSPPITFTVGPNEIAAHMLFDWNNNNDIDVVDVWQPNAVFTPSQFWDGACGAGNPKRVWDWMSKDWDGDSINGGAMVDGPFSGSSANFNVMIIPNNKPTAPVLVSPANGAIDLDTTVEFRWERSTDPDGQPVTYSVKYCTDSGLTAGCTTVDVPNYLLGQKNKSTFYAGWVTGLFMIGMTFIGGLTRRRKLLLLLVIVVLFAVGSFISCGNSSVSGGGGSIPPIQKSYIAPGLTSGTTYYWKVTATDGIDPVDSATGTPPVPQIWSFTTK